MSAEIAGGRLARAISAKVDHSAFEALAVDALGVLQAADE
jgi:hypothetical protein